VAVTAESAEEKLKSVLDPESVAGEGDPPVAVTLHAVMSEEASGPIVPSVVIEPVSEYVSKPSTSSPLYPRKRTLIGAILTSAKGQHQTSLP
jgi:hypothetical protein